MAQAQDVHRVVGVEQRAEESAEGEGNPAKKSRLRSVCRSGCCFGHSLLLMNSASCVGLASTYLAAEIAHAAPSL